MRWSELEEFPDYAVSDEGEVANIRSGMPRQLSMNQQGIAKISLYKNRRELHTRSVAVLVAEAFVEREYELFDTPIHLNGDRQDCRAANLLWRPRWFAIRFHRQFYETGFHEKVLPIIELNTGLEFESVAEACKRLGTHHVDVTESYTREMPITLTGEDFRFLE